MRGGLTTLVLCSALLAGCGPTEVTLEARANGVDANCPHPASDGTPPEPWPIRSIRVEVIEFYSGRAGEVLVSDCAEDIRDLAVVHPQQLINWYDERGYLVRDVPAEIPTRVQIVGFTNPDCTMALRPLGPVICGFNDSVLTESTYSPDQPVLINFWCPDADDPPGALFAYCLGLGTVPDDDRED